MDSALQERLAGRLGPKGYSVDPEILEPHLMEWRGRRRGTTPFLAMPASTEEVADVVRMCSEFGSPITPQGGNTGLVSGQIPEGEILLSLKRMNRIRAVDPIDDAITATATTDRRCPGLPAAPWSCRPCHDSGRWATGLPLAVAGSRRVALFDMV